MKNKIRVLFQGDSITDAGRDRRNYYNMGNGYAKYASELLREELPNAEIEFINLGIGGNRSDQLYARIYHDAIALEPNVISILIGVNDVWHRHSDYEMVFITDEQYALNYRCILKAIKEKTNAKIVMMSPYLLDAADKQAWRPELDRILPIVRSLADEFADVYIPLDELFDEAVKTQPAPLYYSGDGVHPNENGARFIAKHYAQAVKPLLQSL